MEYASSYRTTRKETSLSTSSLPEDTTLGLMRSPTLSTTSANTLNSNDAFEPYAAVLDNAAAPLAPTPTRNWTASFIDDEPILPAFDSTVSPVSVMTASQGISVGGLAPLVPSMRQPYVSPSMHDETLSLAGIMHDFDSTPLLPLETAVMPTFEAFSYDHTMSSSMYDMMMPTTAPMAPNFDGTFISSAESSSATLSWTDTTEINTFLQGIGNGGLLESDSWSTAIVTLQNTMAGNSMYSYLAEELDYTMRDEPSLYGFI